MLCSPSHTLNETGTFAFKQNNYLSFLFLHLGLCANGSSSDIWFHKDFICLHHIVFAVFPYSHSCDCGWMAFQRVEPLENRLQYLSSWPLVHWGRTGTITNRTMWGNDGLKSLHQASRFTYIQMYFIMDGDNFLLPNVLYHLRIANEGASKLGCVSFLFALFCRLSCPTSVQIFVLWG